MRRFLRRLAVSATRRHDEERLQEELEAHLEMQTAEHVRAGVPWDEARRQARVRLGSREAVRASYRDEQGLPALDDIVQDVRYALRQFRRAPLFTVTATVSLGLGIGATAAVFTVTERLLLRPLPVRDPDALVYITDERSLTQASPRFSYPFYSVLADNNILDGVVARFAVPLRVAANGQSGTANGELVSGNYFSVLGAAAMAAGRPLSPEDDRAPGAHPVAVISDSFRRRTFGSGPAVGQSVQLNRQTFTIVGVTANRFTGTDVTHPADIWIPMAMQRSVGRDLMTDTRTNWVEMLGRLRSGMTREQAAGQLTAHLQRRASELPPRVSPRRVVLADGATGSSLARRELGPALATLMALTGLALGLACINVASLVAVRSAAREKEIAIRLALGACRSRLARQLLTEALLLAALGGTAGLLIAPAAARLLVATHSRVLKIDAGVDARVFLFGLGLTMFTGLTVALAPIVASSKVSFARVSERSSTRPTARSRRLTVHDLIVTLQVAFSLAMLITAALCAQSLHSLNAVNPGFRANGLLLVSLDPKAAGYDASRIDDFWRNALERVAQVPGVQSVSLAGTVPLAPGRQRQPWPHPSSGKEIELDTVLVGPRYFRTLELSLGRGREFGDADGRTARPVVIVNERLARLFWPEQDPIGKAVRLPGSVKETAEVVGVVGDAKYRDLRGDTDPMVYRPVLQTRSTDAMTLHIRAAGGPDAMARAIGAALQAIDRNVPLSQVRTLESQLSASFAQTRQAAVLTGVFGILAVLLSGVGVYGVAALAVSRRTRDIGIRMALGAQPGDVIRPIFRQGATVLAAGLGLGWLGSLGFTQVTQTVLFGVAAADGATFAAATVLLALVALAAFSIPLRAATRIDALTAIRQD